MTNNFLKTTHQGRSQKKLMTEAMSMEDLWPRQSVHGWVLFLGIRVFIMTINNKSERNYRGKCLGSPVTSYGGAHPYVARAAYNYKTESAYKTRPYKKLSYKKLKQYHRLETVTSGSGKVSFVDPLMRIWQKCKMRASVISWHTFGGSGKRMFPFVDMAHWCIWYRDKLFDARATEMQIACDPNNTKNKNNFATSARYLSCVPFDFLLTIRNGS